MVLLTRLPLVSILESVCRENEEMLVYGNGIQQTEKDFNIRGGRRIRNDFFVFVYSVSHDEHALKVHEERFGIISNFGEKGFQQFGTNLEYFQFSVTSSHKGSHHKFSYLTTTEEILLQTPL